MTTLLDSFGDDMVLTLKNGLYKKYDHKLKYNILAQRVVVAYNTTYLLM
jgi:hypothetical protein